MQTSENTNYLRSSSDESLRWLENRTIAFVGDSISADLRANYVTLVTDRLACAIDMSTTTIVNCSVDSSSVIDALDRLPDLLIEFKPDVFVIFVGVNDSKIFRFIDRPLLAPTVFEDSYGILLDRIDVERARPKVLITPPPLLFDEIRTGDFLAQYWYWDPVQYSLYVEAIRRLARRPHCALADLERLFDAETTGLRLFVSDGVHPNIYGHRIIAESVIRAFSNLHTVNQNSSGGV